MESIAKELDYELKSSMNNSVLAVRCGSEIQSNQ